MGLRNDGSTRDPMQFKEHIWCKTHKWNMGKGTASLEWLLDDFLQYYRQFTEETARTVTKMDFNGLGGNRGQF